VAFDRDGQRLVSGSSDNTVRVWDAGSGECLEVIAGHGDVAAIADGPTVLPWRALRRGQETVIEASAGGEPFAWFPADLWVITTHPSGRVWAGAVGNYLVLIRLEGEAPPMGSREGGDS
jgi:WD40 repeat protein